MHVKSIGLPIFCNKELLPKITHCIKVLCHLALTIKDGAHRLLSQPCMQVIMREIMVSGQVTAVTISRSIPSALHMQ